MDSWWDIFSSINLAGIFTPAFVAVVAIIGMAATFISAIIVPVEEGWYSNYAPLFQKWARVLIWPAAATIIWAFISLLIFVQQYEPGAWVPLDR